MEQTKLIDALNLPIMVVTRSKFDRIGVALLSMLTKHHPDNIQIKLLSATNLTKILLENLFGDTKITEFSSWRFSEFSYRKDLYGQIISDQNSDQSNVLLIDFTFNRINNSGLIFELNYKATIIEHHNINIPDECTINTESIQGRISTIDFAIK